MSGLRNASLIAAEEAIPGAGHIELVPSERWHIVLHDFGALSGQIEWDSERISDAAWHMDQAWGRWHELPGSDGDVLLSDAMIAYVYDRKISLEAPAYTLTPNAKQQRIVRRRPE